MNDDLEFHCLLQLGDMRFHREISGGGGTQRDVVTEHENQMIEGGLPDSARQSELSSIRGKSAGKQDAGSDIRRYRLDALARKHHTPTIHVRGQWSYLTLPGKTRFRRVRARFGSQQFGG